MSDLNERIPFDELFARYLSALGVRAREPGIDALEELVAAHLTGVPFENISKLYYKKHRGLRGLPGLDLYLDGIERHHFGGTCYANNHYLNLLLQYLGYDAGTNCTATFTDRKTQPLLDRHRRDQLNL